MPMMKWCDGNRPLQIELYSILNKGKSLPVIVLLPLQTGLYSNILKEVQMAKVSFITPTNRVIFQPLKFIQIPLRNYTSYSPHVSVSLYFSPRQSQPKLQADAC